jgi:hypothetical protein
MMAAQVTTGMEHGASPPVQRKRDRVEPSSGDLRIVLDRVESVGDRNDNTIADLASAIRDQGLMIVRAMERIAFLMLAAFGIATVAICTLAGYSLYVGIPGLLQAAGNQ